jgi:hypothetical protein
VTFSPNGDAYYFTLSTSAGNLSAMLVNKSTDGGLTWSGPTVLIDEDDPDNFNDKNSITADPFDSNYVYAVWDRSRFPSDKRYEHSLSGFPHSLRSDAFFSRTTNGRCHLGDAARDLRTERQRVRHRTPDRGCPWRRPPGPLGRCLHPLPRLGVKQEGQEVAVLVSDDRGATWSTPITVSKMMPGFISDPDDGTPLRTEDIIPEIGAGPNGVLYMVWQEQTLAPSGSAIAFSSSVDGGQTWSDPKRINTRPDIQAFNPSVEVLTDGTIAVTHYDLRFNTPDPATLPTDYWFLHSHDGGSTWLETRVTPQSFDFKRAPFARGLFLGDYDGLAVRGGTFITAYGVTTATDPGNIDVSVLAP